MDNKLYIVKHIYYVDGGYGDAIYSEEVVGVVECSEKEIEEYIKEFDKPEIYDNPYADLSCHHVAAIKVDPITIDELRTDPYGDDGYYAREIEMYKEMRGEYGDDD